MSLKVYISPQPAQIRDDNGIGRVIHAQFKYLPEYGIELVSEPVQADVIAAHITGEGLPRVDVLHLHGLYWSGDRGSGQYVAWHHEANRRIVQSARKAHTITVPSPWVGEVFKRDMRLVPDIIGHGLDLDDWDPRPEGTRTPGDYVLWNKNRVGDVCSPDAAVALARRGAHVVSTFGPQHGDLPPSMQVIGTVPHEQMREHVRNAAVYLATTKETFGIGTIEAMASGVPVLGYAFGGTADLVEHGVTGYLVRPGDVDGLWAGLLHILEHRQAMSAAAREAATRYTWDHVMRQYADLYRRMAKERQRAPKGVSVVITNYNYGEYLDEAITSVRNQTYPVDEIIVVDDGSTDNSADICNQSRHRGTFSYIAQTNQGVAAARNTGIAKATQPFVVCLDADDALDPQYVAVCRQALLADPGLGIAYTGLSIYRDGQLSLNAWPPEFNWEIQTTVSNPPSNCIPCAAMFRRSLWERAGGYKQVYAPAEDTEFFTRGLAAGFTAKRVSPEGLFHYRVGHASASNTKHYRPIDTWHPWMRDKQYPLAAPAKAAPNVRSYSEPAISVVIPVGPGHATRLIAALDSLLGQTFRDWEVIVVNDSGDVLPLTAYPFVREVTIGQAHGPADARNEGLRWVRASLVLFLDADDYLLPTALETMLRAFVATGGKVIYTDWLAVNAQGAAEAHESPEYSQAAWLQNGQHAVTALMATAWARDVGGFDELMGGWEDWDFFIKFAIAGYCGARVPEALLAYRQSTGTVRERSLAAKDELLAVLRGRYAGYAVGDKPMSSCCGGNADALLAAKAAIGSLAPDSPWFRSEPAADTLPEVIRMEFTGPQVGAVTFFGKNHRNQYRAGNNPTERYVDVQPDDVAHLEGTGQFRMVTRPSEPSPPPADIVQLHDDTLGIQNTTRAESVEAGISFTEPEAPALPRRSRR
jgi:glycosyltransferase involved in cell wall biosynthesis